jgi:hypothetical protein
MTDDAKKPGEEPAGRPALSCRVCMKEIPGEVEHTLEGQEYVAHFCGLDCYRAWHEARGSDAGETKPKG